MEHPPELAEGLAGILLMHPNASSTKAASSSPSYMRCLQPYRHAHTTSIKGRWLKKPLLEVFSREFAVVGDMNGVDSTQDDVPVVPTVSTDPVVNAFLYAQELVDGTLYIEKGEGECKEAGKKYLDILKEFNPKTGKRFVSSEERDESLLIPRTLEGLTNSEGFVVTKSNDTIEGFFAHLPKLLVLKQSNRFVHVINRSEHSVNLTGGPIEIAHVRRHPPHPSLGVEAAVVGGAAAPAITTATPTTSITEQVVPTTFTPSKKKSGNNNNSGPPAYVAVSKPSSIGIHPAGRFQKNTLLRILEDIFNAGVVVNKGGAAQVSQRGRLLFGLLVKETEERGVGDEVRRFTDIHEPLLQRKVASLGSGVRSNKGPPSVYELVETTTSSTSCNFEFAPVPTIRIPHSKVSKEDRMWLLAKLLVRNTDGTTVSSSSSVFGDRQVVFDSNELKEAVVAEATSTTTTSSTSPPPLKLFIVHRLDRCTSGVIILALDGKSASKITDTFAASEKAVTKNDEERGNDAEGTKDGGELSFTSTGARVVTNTTCDTSKRNKQYLAKVYGDMRELFIENNDNDGSKKKALSGTSSSSACFAEREGGEEVGASSSKRRYVQIIIPSLATQSPSSPSSATPTTTASSNNNHTIITNGGIYCTSCQLANYWCLDSSEQERYEAYLRTLAERDHTRQAASAGKRAREEGEATTAIPGEQSFASSWPSPQQQEKDNEEGTAATTTTTVTPTAGRNNDTTKEGSKSETSEWLTFSGVKENRSAAWEQRVYGLRGINGAPEPPLDSNGNPMHIEQDEAQHFANMIKLKSAVSSLTVVAVTRFNAETQTEEPVPLDTSATGASGGDQFYSYVACTPHTGRTHQLRIHLAACGYPIVYDTKYQNYLRRLREGGSSIGNSSASGTTPASLAAEDSKGGGGGNQDGEGDFLDPEIICLHAHSYSLPISTSGEEGNDDENDSTIATVVTAEVPNWYCGPRDFSNLHSEK